MTDSTLKRIRFFFFTKKFYLNLFAFPGILFKHIGGVGHRRLSLLRIFMNYILYYLIYVAIQLQLTSQTNMAKCIDLKLTYSLLSLEFFKPELHRMTNISTIHLQLPKSNVLMCDKILVIKLKLTQYNEYINNHSVVVQCEQPIVKKSSVRK